MTYAAVAAASAEQENKERVKQLTDRLADTEAQLKESKANYENFKEANSAMNAELTVAQEQLCESLKLLDEKCRQLEELESQKSESIAAEKEVSQEDTAPQETKDNEKD